MDDGSALSEPDGVVGGGIVPLTVIVMVAIILFSLSGYSFSTTRPLPSTQPYTVRVAVPSSTGSTMLRVRLGVQLLLLDSTSLSSSCMSRLTSVSLGLQIAVIRVDPTPSGLIVVFDAVSDPLTPCEGGLTVLGVGVGEAVAVGVGVEVLVGVGEAVAVGVGVEVLVGVGEAVAVGVGVGVLVGLGV